MRIIRDATQLAKKVFFSCCVLCNRLISQRGVPVFLYHSIDATGSPISTHPDNFHWQMRYLYGRGWRTMRLDELLDALKSRRLPKKRFVITFDDGFKNLLTAALPVLKEFGFTATVYLATEFVGRTNSYVKVVMPSLPMLSWDDLRILRGTGWDIESHGHTHRNLTDLDMSQAHWELAVSRDHIRKNLGVIPKHFCYPRGRYSMPVVGAVRAAGYQSAASFRSGLVRPSSNPWLLERLPVNDRATPLHFRALLTEPYAWITALRRGFRQLLKRDDLY